LIVWHMTASIRCIHIIVKLISKLVSILLLFQSFLSLFHIS
jgi:hypothetical protein